MIDTYRFIDPLDMRMRKSISILKPTSKVHVHRSIRTIPCFPILILEQDRHKLASKLPISQHELRYSSHHASRSLQHTKPTQTHSSKPSLMAATFQHSCSAGAFVHSSRTVSTPSLPLPCHPLSRPKWHTWTCYAKDPSPSTPRTPTNSITKSVPASCLSPLVLA